MPLTTQEIKSIQSKAKNVRNVCILAHVDHGKTTLSDNLLACNNIISKKLAGKVRYLDSRKDEQLRGITMESSAITLSIDLKSKNSDDEWVVSSFIVNLIDSPGHIDFSSEVSSASRLCDGCLILVDAVEGVCTQTHMVLQQAWKEKLSPILVLNKIDRLITELQFTTLEAYNHLNKILEQVNVIMAGFYQDDIVQRGDRLHEKAKTSGAKVDDESLENKVDEMDDDDADIYFSPVKGNVMFSSAIDGWAFRLHNFAKIYAQKFNLKESTLIKCLWGDFYFDAKNKKVLLPKQLKGKSLKPMFVQLVLDNIWAVYDSVHRADSEKVQKIITSLNVKVQPRDMKSKDPKVLLSAIMSQWLPINSILVSIIEQIPSPLQAQPKRLPDIWYNNSDIKPEPTKLETDLFNCSSEADAEVIAYVSKTFYVNSTDLPENKRKQLTADEMRSLNTRESYLKSKAAVVDPGLNLDEISQPESQPSQVETNEEVLIGFARIFSGTIKVGQKIYVLGPKYNPKFPNLHCSEVTVEKLYLIMGTELMALDEVPAGNVFGISGLDGHIIKSGTLTTDKSCHNLGALRQMPANILRVALEPTYLTDMPKLIKGLQLLNMADPCVEVISQETGEHVIVTAGELHLERCLTDLRERYANIEIQASAPLVPFRETIQTQDPILNSYETIKLIEVESPTKTFKVGIKLLTLPTKLYKFLTQHHHTIKNLLVKDNEKMDAELELEEHSLEDALEQKPILTSDSFRAQLQDILNKCKDPIWHKVINRIVAFGPKRTGPNLLINNLDYSPNGWFNMVTNATVTQPETPDWLASRNISLGSFEESLTLGFQLFTNAGPLCNEPCLGLACFLESFTFLDTDPDQDIRPNLSGALISTTKEAMRTAFLAASPRLLLATYTCNIQATAEVLGKVYALLNQRKGKIVSEEMLSGTTTFQIHARLPMIESMDFANQIRSKTSGAAFPQLVFDGFDLLDQDPFWIPTTQDELEELGTKADKENLAKKYMDLVRERKGLLVEKKRIEAEKQRTLKK